MVVCCHQESSQDSRMSCCRITAWCLQSLAPDLVAGSQTGLSGDSKGIMLTYDKGLCFLPLLPDWDAGPRKGFSGDWIEVKRAHIQVRASL